MKENSMQALAADFMRREADAILEASRRLDNKFDRAIELLSGAEGKLVFSGIGKSGHIGRKLAATFSSLGRPAVFMHAAEAVHGDLGVFQRGDLVLVLSKSGATPELVQLMPVFRELGVQVIGILGNLSSPLAAMVDVALDGSVKTEADPLGIAPTSSAVVALAIGDALAVALSGKMRFSREDFLRLHPAGQLGKNLHLRVDQLMHRLEGVACLSPEETVGEAVIAMSRYPLGACCIVGSGNELLGLFTDGDVRRCLERYEVDLRSLTLASVMTKDPVCAPSDLALVDAIELMEGRSSQISVLPVVEQNRRLVGLLRLHDVYQGGKDSVGPL